ncbi:MAG: hypothetical protein V4603_03150, partial [Pseudomonadota bacterium]
MRIQSAPDLLLATVDNAAAGASASAASMTDGDKAQGSMFAQLMQALPVDAAGETAGATVAAIAGKTAGDTTAIPAATATVTQLSALQIVADNETAPTLVAASTSAEDSQLLADMIVSNPVTTTAVATVTAAVELPVIKLPVFVEADTSAPTRVVQPVNIEAVDVPASEPMALTTPTVVETDDAAAATSARMLSALRREFIPTPVLSPPMTPPAIKATAVPAGNTQQLPTTGRSMTSGEHKTVTTKSTVTTNSAPARHEPTSAPTHSAHSHKSEPTNASTTSPEGAAESVLATTAPDDKITQTDTPVVAAEGQPESSSTRGNNDNDAATRANTTSASPAAAAPQLTTAATATATTALPTRAASSTITTELPKPVS